MATVAIGLGLGVLDAVWPRIAPFLQGRGKKKLAMAMAAVQASDSEDAIKLLRAQMLAAIEVGDDVDAKIVQGWMFLVEVAMKHSDRAGDILRGFDDDAEPTGE